MAVKVFTIGPLATNCYLFTDEESGKSALIDPACATELLLETAASAEVEYILVTHAHADHIAGLNEIKRITDAKVVAHANEESRLSGSYENMYAFIGEYEQAYVPTSVDIYAADGAEIKLGKSVISVLHTPGHTDGSVCYVVNDVIFAGDTLFYESYGRTDLPSGSFNSIVDSYALLCGIDGDFKLLPGHGKMTTLSHERENNPLARYII